MPIQRLVSLRALHKWCVVAIMAGVFSCIAVGFIQQAHCQQRTDFDQTLQAWKDKLKELAVLQREFNVCEEHEADDIRKRWRATKAEGDRIGQQLVKIGTDVYEASNIDNQEIKQLLEWAAKQRYAEGQYRETAMIGQSLLRHDPQNFPLVFDTVRAAFFANEFDLVVKLIDDWQSRSAGESPELQTLGNLATAYQSEWQRELELREKEKNADLPQLELVTSKGKIVIELFEEQAPNSVNSLVHLVETDFFKNMTFFEVFEHQYALTGCPFNNGSGGPDMGILSEGNLPNARKHFRGTVSLRVNPQDQSARSQFYLLKIPMPDFDQQHVVVGRVIEGMDVVDSLTATHKLDRKLNPVPIQDAAPDHFISIKVLKKRDHEYRPEVIGR